MKWAEKAAKYEVTPDRILKEESRIAFSNVVKLFNEQWAFLFHPLANTSTLVISREDIQRFVEATGHELTIIDVPG